MARNSLSEAGPEEARAALGKLIGGEDVPSALWVVSGPRGSGRTALLSTVAQRCRRAGTAVLSVPYGDGTADALDLLCTGLRQLLDRVDRPELRGARSAIARLQNLLTTGATVGSLPVAHELITVLTAVAAHTPVMLLLDDVDLNPPEIASALVLVAEGVRPAGISTVATSARHGSAHLRQLLALADGTIDLRPLTGTEMAELVRLWTAGKDRTSVDAGLLSALRDALGPLFGNPATTRQTLAALRADGRLVVVDEHVCLTGSDLPISLPFDHPLVHAVQCRGQAARRLATVFAVLGEDRRTGVDDLPALVGAIGLSLPEAGRALDELVRDGVLRVEANGQLRPAAPALGVALRRRHGPRWRQALHGGLASRMLAEDEGASPDRAELAWHLAELAPGIRNDVGAEVLITEAAEAGTADPALACRYRLAAIRLLSPADERWAGLVRGVLRARFELGRYGELADELASTVAAELLPPGRPGVPDDLLAAVLVCWLAALGHENRLSELDRAIPLLDELGRRTGLPEEATRLLESVRRSDPENAAAAVQALTGGTGPDELVEVAGATLLASLAGDHVRLTRAWLGWTGSPTPAETAEPADLLDRVSVLEGLTGDRYGVPVRGLAAGYHQVRAAYRSGDWRLALSLVRRLEGDRLSWPHAPQRQLAIAVAAEICSQRGELDRAISWFYRLSGPVATSAFAGWVQCGLRRHAGRTEDAVHRGWRDYVRCRDAGSFAGSERLLSRLLDYSTQLGDRVLTEQMLDELTALGERHPAVSVREAVLVFGGQVRKDPATVYAGVRLARRSGDTFRFAQACATMGSLSQNPGPWLQRAHSTMKSLGATTGLTTVSELMREHGVHLPRERRTRATLDAFDLRVAELVSNGRTNRQIAAALQVSEKRVEGHLTSLFERTGCHSRVELAAAWLQGRLTAPV